MNRKNLLLMGATAMVCISIFATMAFTQKTTVNKIEYKQITSVESVVPGGMGRSRIITTDETGSKVEEIKLENFYSLVGINFGNIMHNDIVITQKISQLANDGWELQEVTTGVESGADKTGLFITRYLFKKVTVQ